MIKSVIKELAIILLLLIAIGLTFSIIFYEYNPVNISVPSKVQAYELPNETQLELEETLKEAETQELVKTYLVDGSDLEIYKSTKDYDSGKVNPFEKYSEENVETGSANNNTQNNSTTTSNNGNQGQFLNTVGK